MRDKKHAVSEKHTPGQNHLLAALPRADLERLLPDLEHVSLPLGETLYGPGDRQRHLYFMTAGIVSQFYLMDSGASAGFAVTGSEGVVGVASFLGGESMPSEAVVLSAGYAYRLGGILLRHEFEHGGPLQRLLLRYTHALITQTAQTVACNRHHPVEQQLCRWLLLSLDRLPSNEVTMTQELLASMLGVRRESVTEAASKFQAAGLIRYGRGRIAVLDRPRLEAQACECYAVVKRAYDGLLRPESIFGNAGVHSGFRHNVSVGEGIAQPELN
ncbi:MAG: Crp/Fnr family transcriptional regulator [Betaproteobacteria bacterium]|nr:MAG: Crp/Fnr family transcriptional regulator [Betaproteobacteria bacterium]